MTFKQLLIKKSINFCLKNTDFRPLFVTKSKKNKKYFAIGIPKIFIMKILN